MISREYQQVLEKISSVELTRKESDRLKVITRDEKITKSLNVSFDDPILGRVFVESFEDPFLRTKFFDDPILAVDKLKDRNSRRRFPLDALLREIVTQSPRRADWSDMKISHRDVEEAGLGPVHLSEQRHNNLLDKRQPPSPNMLHPRLETTGNMGGSVSVGDD